MSNMSDRAERKFNQMRAKPQTPEWYPIVGAVAGVVFLVFLAVQLMSGGSDTPATDAFGNPLDQTSVPASVPTSAPTTEATVAPDSTTTTDGSESSTTTEPAEPVEETIVLADVNGNGVDVPRGAYDVALAATTALFTGAFDTVPTDPSVTPPALPATWADPQVDSPTVVGGGDGTITVSFLVDPDRGGPEQIRRIDTVVARLDTGWVWLGV